MSFNVLIGLRFPELARTLQVQGQGNGEQMDLHPAVAAATLLMLALAVIGALVSSGVLP